MLGKPFSTSTTRLEKRPSSLRASSICCRTSRSQSAGCITVSGNLLRPQVEVVTRVDACVFQREAVVQRCRSQGQDVLPSGIDLSGLPELYDGVVQYHPDLFVRLVVHIQSSPTWCHDHDQASMPLGLRLLMFFLDGIHRFLLLALLLQKCRRCQPAV